MINEIIWPLIGVCLSTGLLIWLWTKGKKIKDRASTNKYNYPAIIGIIIILAFLLGAKEFMNNTAATCLFFIGLVFLFYGIILKFLRAKGFRREQ